MDNKGRVRAELEPAEELGQITARLRTSLQRTAEDIIAVGRDLIRAKALLPHGQFGQWIERELGLSPRYGTQFMLAAARFGGKPEAVAGLPGGLLLELASPSVPDGLVEAVLAGKIEPRVVKVREQLRAHGRRVASRRAATDLVDELWALPDEPEDAGPVLARAVLAQADGLAIWAIFTFRLAADIIEQEAGAE